VVPPDSHGISRAPCYLGYIPGANIVSSTGVLPTMPALSHRLRLRHWFLTPCQAGRPDWNVPRPRLRNPCRVSHANGLASSGFARHYSRNHCCFLFLTVLRCFTSRRSLHTPYIQAWVTALTCGRVSPFGHPRITARLTAPRGLSRSTTSFIGSWCQGIHRAPLKTWPQRCSHPLFRSQTPTGSPPGL
jgi:hypothetical protein